MAQDADPPETTGTGGAPSEGSPPEAIPVGGAAAEVQPEAIHVGGAAAEAGQPEAPAAAASAPQIAGLSVMKGLILYAATLTFVALYAYFMAKIFAAKPGNPPTFDGTLVSAAAALAGVLGSAFALQIGTPTDESGTNAQLGRALSDAVGGSNTAKVLAQIRRALSLEPRDVQSASWPKTFGIWAYAVVGAAVAITYVTNQSETPSTLKALAVAFGGYVITLVTTAYGIKTKGNS